MQMISSVTNSLWSEWFVLSIDVVCKQHIYVISEISLPSLYTQLQQGGDVSVNTMDMFLKECQLRLFHQPMMYNPLQFNDNIMSISCGSAHWIAVTNTNQLYSFGLNTWGQLGTGDQLCYEITPINITLQFPNNCRFLTTSCGPDRSYVILTPMSTHPSVGSTIQQLFGWGRNHLGQLGKAQSTQLQLLPIHIECLKNDTVKSIQTISCGLHHTMAITTCGTLYGWGYNGTGQLGLGTTTPIINQPTTIIIKNSNQIELSVQQVSCHIWHSLIMTTNGEIFQCGTSQLSSSTCTINNQTHPFINKQNHLSLFPWTLYQPIYDEYDASDSERSIVEDLDYHSNNNIYYDSLSTRHTNHTIKDPINSFKSPFTTSLLPYQLYGFTDNTTTILSVTAGLFLNSIIRKHDDTIDLIVWSENWDTALQLNLTTLSQSHQRVYNGISPFKIDLYNDSHVQPPAIIMTGYQQRQHINDSSHYQCLIGKYFIHIFYPVA